MLSPTDFRRDGFALVTGVFSPEEISRLRETVVEVIAAKEAAGAIDRVDSPTGVVRIGKGDLLSTPELRPVLLDRRVLRVIRLILEGDPVYFGDSSVRIGSTQGHWGWHRDNADANDFAGPDWNDPFPLVRCALYLQDHSRHSGGLGIRPRSHRIVDRTPRAELVPSAPGDLVVWDLRVLHAGEVLRYRPLRSLAIRPRYLGVLNRLGLRVPEERERMAMFMTFGLTGHHLDHFIEYLATREYARAAWSASRVDSEALEAASRAGLEVREVPPYYSIATVQKRSAEGQARALGQVVQLVDG